MPSIANVAYKDLEGYIKNQKRIPKEMTELRPVAPGSTLTKYLDPLIYGCLPSSYPKGLKDPNMVCVGFLYWEL